MVGGMEWGHILLRVGWVSGVGCRWWVGIYTQGCVYRVSGVGWEGTHTLQLRCVRGVGVGMNIHTQGWVGDGTYTQ